MKIIILIIEVYNTANHSGEKRETKVLKHGQNPWNLVNNFGIFISD